MKRLICALAVAGLVSAGGTVLGDTGTYRIVSYRIGLTPRSDGTVAIDYYQKWLVTGGHIPWITVGTPNSDFAIAGYGGAVTRAAPAGRGGWSGVRLDLDADYRSGQTFEAVFSIIQRGLFHSSEGTYRLDFTPGWYDRARIDTLRIGVTFFARIETVTARPEPAAVSDDEMVWERRGLGEGERFSIHVSFPAELFPAGIAAGSERAGRRSSVPIAAAIAIFVLLFFIVLMAARLNKRRYSGGKLYYGGFFGGAFRGGGAGGRSGGGRSAGGGGGFGGASMSCACACVSCACACACAGGGGAGCSRKLEHSCPMCAPKEGR
jgi:hypothetical protein